MQVGMAIGLMTEKEGPSSNPPLKEDQKLIKSGSSMDGIYHSTSLRTGADVYVQDITEEVFVRAWEVSKHKQREIDTMIGKSPSATRVSQLRVAKTLHTLSSFWESANV